ncbi:DNA adenine methylase [Sunxiuqinia elliptica]|uniref:site-specific DNA-methyltransferase (adenine-specific) n=1 Tax=Sunxiuqinia elliptica TaxID=655355 RepID=A0A4R6H8R1_9BACT|nr:DNA adenine methylase [Sunxiuqinia elliptica]TDO04682.1 DNA adenine methylase [Sunxiuqinia elliptica]TDO64230.1 DNA adenine methylase [Sunxiuqinia elliptica]
MFYSPLRYPGGKNKLSAFIAKICVDNSINGLYVEPYAGGASIALFLLFEGFVDKIIINDKDRSIYAFWHSVINKPNELCELIDRTEVTIENWQKLREVQEYKNKADLLNLGFSTLFMNRTNRSGIITGGPIGGYKQLSEYKLDCRFNKQEIKRRIVKIASRKKDIKVYKKDALKLIDLIEEKANEDNTVIYFDPPYYLKASSLYMNHYSDDNHKTVCDRIKNISSIRWIVSYDNVPEIQDLYADFEKKEYSFKHTAYKVRDGKEILFFSNDLKKPKIPDWNPTRFKYKKTKTTANILYRE